MDAFTRLRLKLAKAFAPGIPAARPPDPLPKIDIDTLNRWTLAVQEHVTPRGPYSEKTRTHYDLRLVDPDSGKAHSWAIPKAMLPKPGNKVLAVQTFTHTPDYALHFGERGPQTIGKGYGKGTVTMALKAPTDIVESSKDHVRFNTYEGKDLNEYLLRRTNGKSWLLMNTTATRDRRPDIPESKPKYKEVSPAKIDLHRDDQIMQAKIDGAHNSIVLEPGKQVRIFSHRPTERDTGLIEHTHRFLPGFKQVVPESLPKIIIRADLAAVDPVTGKARRAVDTGAVLNSGVWKSRDLQTHMPLRAFIHDVVQVGSKDLSKAPYTEKLEVLKEVHKALPFLELPPMAHTPEEKKVLLQRIHAGKEPLTSEGVVLWPVAGGAPIKAKFKPDFDVYVRKIFPEKSERKQAGGFEYSWSANGPIAGRVGTGFSNAIKKEMLKDPGDFMGRVAKVQAQGKYEGGALRAPAFKEWHLDKGVEKAGSMPEVHAYVTGPSGAGKTTYVNKNFPEDQYHHLHSDAYKKIVKDPDGGVIRLFNWRKAIEDAKASGKPVVVDSLNIHEPLAEIAKNKILLHVPEEESLHRRHARNVSEFDRDPAEGRAAYEHFTKNMLPVANHLGFTKTATLYHGSPGKHETLNPRNEHGDPDVYPSVVFATPDRTFALAYAGRWTDREINQETRGGPHPRMILREMQPGALDAIYKGKTGFIHHVPENTFVPVKGQRTTKEVVSFTPVVPTKIERIPDVLEALKNTPGVELAHYDINSPLTRSAVVRHVRRMLEQPPERQEKYTAWRLRHAPEEMKKLWQDTVEQQKKADDHAAISKHQAFVNELRSILQKADVTPRHAIIGGSGTLGALGLKEIHDLDVQIPNKKVWKEISKLPGAQVSVAVSGSDVARFKTPTGEIEVFAGPWKIKGQDFAKKPTTAFQEIRHWTPETTLAWKKLMGRPKDMVDIKALQTHLKEKTAALPSLFKKKRRIPFRPQHHRGRGRGRTVRGLDWPAGYQS